MKWGFSFGRFFQKDTVYNTNMRKTKETKTKKKKKINF